MRGVLLVALLLASCAPSEWTKPPSATTCSDWLLEMTPEQQTEMAGPVIYDTLIELGADPDLLTDETLTDEVIAEVVDDITELCEDEPAVATIPTVLEQGLNAIIEGIFREVEENLR